MVPTRVLLEQWLVELRKVYLGPVGQYGDGVHDLQAVTVATYESAFRHMALLGNRFELLVVDEAHHFGGGLRDEALDMSLAPARLGLTATPPADASGRRLCELLGPVLFEMTIPDLAGRYLASFEALTLHLDLTPGERERYDDLMAAFRPALTQFTRTVPGAGWDDFARAAVRTDAGRRALAAWREAHRLLAYPEAKRETLRALFQQHHGAKVLVFTADNATAYAVSRQLLIMPITCDIQRKERDEVLARFRAGKLRALVSAQVLNEGLDVPDADVAIIVGGKLGAREHVQRIGRLLRPAPGKHALAYEFVMRRTLESRQATQRRKGLAPHNRAAHQHAG